MPPDQRIVAWARLHSQRLAAGRLARAVDVVTWMGAVQAQEYAHARWALALRMRRATEASVERALRSGTILRTHVLRPTWHFVSPADIRWMLALAAPRIRALLAHYDRKLGITSAVIRRANRAVAAALAGGTQLTRAELKVALERAGVNAAGTQRLAHIVMHAELDGLICSGARRGQQFTYALLEDRVPPAPILSRDEGLAELARRYFTSHGPAQLRDFAWWSGLTAREARAGLEMSRGVLGEEVVGGQRYWFAASGTSFEQPPRTAFLLPLYDEYLVAYKDRGASLDPVMWGAVAARDLFVAPVVLDGRVVGGWKRTLRNGALSIVLDLPGRPSRADARRIHEAALRYGAFLGLDVEVTGIAAKAGRPDRRAHRSPRRVG